MHLPHTYVENFDLAYTCTNNGRSEPKQMDYMATTAPSRGPSMTPPCRTIVPCP